MLLVKDKKRLLLTSRCSVVQSFSSSSPLFHSSSSNQERSMGNLFTATKEGTTSSSSGTVSAAIDKEVEAHAVAVFAKSWCGYSKRAHTMLDAAYAEAGGSEGDFFWLDIDKGEVAESMDAYQDELKKKLELALCRECLSVRSPLE